MEFEYSVPKCSAWPFVGGKVRIHPETDIPLLNVAALRISSSVSGPTNF